MNKIRFNMMMGEELLEKLKFTAEEYGLTMSDIVTRGTMKELMHMKKYGIWETWNHENKVKTK